MKTLVGTVVFFAILALVVSVSAINAPVFVHNIAHFAAWFATVAVVLGNTDFASSVIDLDKGKEITAKRYEYAVRMGKRGKIGWFFALIRVFGMALAMASAGWFVAASFYLAFCMIGWASILKFKELQQAKTA
ncbi:hypothetical protein [Pseudomonas phage PPpW-3]|uniref:Uncharacterized protein n=1 Tax=Pseudomonas phage PPpW-3 TaxID=1279082 RepID=V5YSU9_9CAUD|nr:hypothetical protein X916_gp35 [Pseudomonas phage PPpW-3]BAO20635.1 hypothetical protein [Pseudomonas phage PPpW-3]